MAITDTQQIAYSFIWCLLCVGPTQFPTVGYGQRMVNGIKDLSSFIQVELGTGGSPLESQKAFLSMIIAPLSQERRVMRVGVLEGFIMSASLSLLVLWAQVPRMT